MHSQFFHFELDFMQFSKQPFAAYLNGDFLLILQYRSARFCLLFFLNESVPSEPLCNGGLGLRLNQNISLMIYGPKGSVRWLLNQDTKLPFLCEYRSFSLPTYLI